MAAKPALSPVAGLYCVYRRGRRHAGTPMDFNGDGGMAPAHEQFTTLRWGENGLFCSNMTDLVASNTWCQVGVSRKNCAGSDLLYLTAGLFGRHSGQNGLFLSFVGKENNATLDCN